ncbi:MAG: helix-turn-helix domain-containing protein, partial [Sulfurimonas sp.]|uniref:helix-turn-helix domain-containing protein n=1 Tax=Sulfurimonas sp. TaxID=2022749 RepID=UPI0028CDE597
VLLAEYYLHKYANKYDKQGLKINQKAIQKLLKYKWPGNVRELENTIERIVLMGSADGISASDMILLLPALNNQKLSEEYCAIAIENKTLDELEKEAIIKALKSTNDNQSEAAKLLGITQRQIGYKIKNYGI